MKLTNDKMILGLDIGIGSVGWALVNIVKKRIEDLGVRIFESGEEGAKKSSDRASQQARTHRARRRLNRRNKQRKNDLKKFLEKIGLITIKEIDHCFKYHLNNNNIVFLRYKGLDEKLSTLDIVSILLNIANYRGYKDFYDEEDSKKKNKFDETIDKIENLMNTGKYRTIGELFYLSEEFNVKNSLYKSYRNHNNYNLLIDRNYLIKEIRLILFQQSNYYSILTNDVIDNIIAIIFRQRLFEEGPGPATLKNKQSLSIHTKGQRVYSGFNNKIGKCTYLEGEIRGTRNSVIFDVYSLINDLSQLTFYDNNGEVIKNMNKFILEELLHYLYNHNGTIESNELLIVAKNYNLNVYIPKKYKKSLTYNYINFLTNNDYFDTEYIEIFKNELENFAFLDENCLSQKIGTCITNFITPSKRKEELSKLLTILNENKIKQLSLAQSYGIANLSTKYMTMAIESFIDGMNYGDFQADLISKIDDSIDYKLVKNGKLLPIKDADLIRNPVVFKSINETRKIINALLDLYDIDEIHIEVANDVSRSFEQREEMYKNQLKNQVDNKKVELELLSLMNIHGINKPISPKMIERYKLWKIQNERCLYTYTKIPFLSVINSDNTFQVDHIIPQSIILDDTLANKALILRTANSCKDNRLPLECMGENGFMDKQDYIRNISSLKEINDKKRKYLLLEELNDDIVKQFVSRNINDTRYIAKYITNYIKKAFIQMGKEIEVITLKGSITSRFRKRWLKEYTDSGIIPSDYSFTDKGRNLHYYHHAVDAVIIANMQKKYIALANGYERLREIKKDKYLDNQEKKKILQREKDSLIQMLEKHYHMNSNYVKSLLSKKYIPAVCNNLKEQVERMIPLEFTYVQNKSPYVFGKDMAEYIKFKYLHNEIKSSIKNNENYDKYLDDINMLSKNLLFGIIYSSDGTYFDGKEIRQIEKQDIKKLEPKLQNYIDNIRLLNQNEYIDRLSLVCNDKEFLSRVKVPYISYRIDRKFSDSYLSSDNPVSFKMVKEELGVSSIEELVSYCNSEEGLKCPYYVRYLNEYGNGKKNYMIYEAKSYYCVEIYVDKNGKDGMRGIKYIDLRNKNGKLVLLKPLPEGYKHVMYLFKNEYISIFKKGRNNKDSSFVAAGGIKSVNRNNIYIKTFNNKNLKGEGLVTALSSNIIKHEIDILGKYKGDIKCGDLLSFTMEND